MKFPIIIVITSLIIACSSSQLNRQDSNSKAASNQSKRYKITGDEEPPYVIRKAQLEYPAFAQRNNIEGNVILQVEIFVDGTVGHIEIIKSLMAGPGGLDEAAVNSVKKWKFSPAKHKGKPVNCWTTIPIKFELK